MTADITTGDGNAGLESAPKLREGAVDAADGELGLDRRAVHEIGDLRAARAVNKVPYTQGTWHVKPGMSDVFIAAWTEFAEWTAANVPGAGTGRLLQDLDRRDFFVSVGPWESLEAISAWRQMDGWRERVTKIRDLLVSFEATTLELVAER